MTVYARTNAGRLMAFDTAPGIPAPLKDLLRRVDGKTRQAQLMRNPGDESLLQHLVQKGLVQVVSALWRSSMPTSEFVAAQPISLAAMVAPPDDTKIVAVKALMGQFVQACLPQYAGATLPEIAALKSKAELLCMLTGYIDLANRAGRDGQKHVQQLLLELAHTDA